MDLLLDLNQQEGGVWIDGNHRVFEKSEYEGLRFRIKIKPLTRSELRRIRREAEGSSRGNIDPDIYLPKIFQHQVIDWELKDGRGQPIPFSEETKLKLIEQFPGFTNLVAAACLDAQARRQLEVEDEVKNS
ncbi:MAG: hypothetical protein K6U11_05310 [bacterium]|nr:hypothetical protein [bacterium]